MTLEEKATKALVHVIRAEAALRAPTSILRARSELAKALDILLLPEHDPYADEKLRPGLNLGQADPIQPQIATDA